MIGKRIPLLDQGWIELQDVMGDDHSIIEAARASYQGHSKGDAADKKLLFYLMEHQHTTPFEMVEFKFRVRAPLMTCVQWWRHRTWSYNSLSARYTEAEDNQFYLPTEWRLQSTTDKQGSGAVYDGPLHFTQALETMYALSMVNYRSAIQAGIAREQARLFLHGFGFYYTFVAKVDAHNLMHFLKLRMTDHAQYEIRVYAQAIYEHFFRPLLPWTAEAFELYNTIEE